MATMRSSHRWTQLLICAINNELEQFTMKEFRGGRGDDTFLPFKLTIDVRLRDLPRRLHLSASHHCNIP